jgi:AAA15 family ATPase/GTPase
MRITTLRLSNFQSFGPEPTAIDLDDLTYVLGVNGSGKTAVLEALSRFSVRWKFSAGFASTTSTCLSIN